MERLYDHNDNIRFISTETIDRVIRQVFSETETDILGWKVNPETGKVVKDGEDDFGATVSLHNYLAMEIEVRK